jgi:uncharacterized protein
MPDYRFAHRRETKFAETAFDLPQQDGAFCGYASIFGEIDLGNDIIQPGAFSKALAMRGAAGIRMLFQHNADMPIGAWQVIREDTTGLRVAGRLATATARGREVLELMRARAIDGLSVGFRTVRATTDPTTGARRIVEADLWEISVVTFPMQPRARIGALKSAGAGLATRFRLAAIRLEPLESKRK